MMFDRIRSWFSDAPAGSELPERKELSATCSAIEEMRAAVKSCENRIAELENIIAAGATAERDLQTLVASPAGVAGLSAFAKGQEKGPVARYVNAGDRAAQAAEVARNALPAAKRDLAAAAAELVRFEEQKKRVLAKIMRAHGDVLGRRYKASFQELAELHDQIVGFARACASSAVGLDVIMTSEVLEAPRFALPSLSCATDYTTGAGGGFTSFLRHVPSAQTIAAAALAWSRFAHQLAADPQAQASELFSPELMAEVGRHPEHTGSIKSWVRERNEPDASVNEVLYGPENRERRHRMLASQ